MKKEGAEQSEESPVIRKQTNREILAAKTKQRKISISEPSTGRDGEWKKKKPEM